MSTLVTVQMQMVTSTTLILQLVIAYGTIHAMNTIEKWSSKRNESVQVMWYFYFVACSFHAGFRHKVIYLQAGCIS